jgi:hypothetical protein
MVILMFLFYFLEEEGERETEQKAWRELVEKLRGLRELRERKHLVTVSVQHGT